MTRIEQHLSKRAVADMLGVSTRTVDRYVAERRLRVDGHVGPQRRRRFALSQVQEFMEGNCR